MLTYLTQDRIQHFITEALQEDIGPGDYSTLACFPPETMGKVRLLCKDEGILAGVEMAQAIIRFVEPSAVFEMKMKDGDACKHGDEAFYLTATVRTLLSCERLLLNCMQRMSGIATHTRRLSDMVKHTNVCLLDTRKTTPNFRLAEKWAVHIGGGHNHRFALYDMVMLKDNHIDFCGGIPAAMEKTRSFLREQNLAIDVEVEIRTLDELDQALAETGIRRVLLDNMTPAQIRQCVEWVGGKLETEASGGINEKNLVDYAETGVDFISLGTLTYGARPLDISLKAINLE